MDDFPSLVPVATPSLSSVKPLEVLVAGALMPIDTELGKCGFDATSSGIRLPIEMTFDAC